MKLRFGIDGATQDRIREALDLRCEDPPIGRRLAYVYLDTPDAALASQRVALRFRRTVAIGVPSPTRPWRRQTLWSDNASARPIKKLGIKRLRQRLDATFDVRIERWTWQIDTGWAVSLDRSVVSTGRNREAFTELRIVCKRKHRDDATAFAVELGATHLASTKARDRGAALLKRDAPVTS